MGVGLDDRADAWQVVAASTVGSRHAAAERPCDDANAHWQDAGGLVLLAADGAGSAPRAADGARSAVAAAQAEAIGLLGAVSSDDHDATRAGLTRLLVAAREALVARAAEDHAAPGDLATTLTVVLLASETVAVAQVGDGAVVLRRAAGQFELLVGPEHGEYVNETTFLTSDAYLDSAQIVVADARGVSGVAAMTDGLHVVALDLAARAPHPPFFEPLFGFAAGDGAPDQDLAAFLGSELVCARTDDDKTLVLAVRRGMPG
jgi:hypothetical protein